MKKKMQCMQARNERNEKEIINPGYALFAHEKLPPELVLSSWIARPDTQRPQAQIVVPITISEKLSAARRIFFGDEK